MATSLLDAVIAATITVLANGLGGAPFLFIKTFPPTAARLSWAVSGGLMLSASVFNLIMPGVEDAGFTPVAVGIFLGAGMMALLAWRLDNHQVELQGISAAGSRRIVMVIATLSIHSFPEGLAIGVAYGSGEAGLGLLMAIAIAIHNIPEGLAVALPLRAEGVSPWKAIGWALFSGLPQLIATVPAFLAVMAFRPILPYALGFAAGAMIFLVMSEMIPESRASETQRLSSALAGMAGFLGMMVLQNVIVAV